MLLLLFICWTIFGLAYLLDWWK